MATKRKPRLSNRFMDDPMPGAKARRSKPAKRKLEPADPMAVFREFADDERRRHVSRWQWSAGAYRYRPNLMVVHLLPFIALDVNQESYGWSLQISVSFLHGHAYAQVGKW